MHNSVGTLRYGETHRLVLEVDQGLADYYRSLIPKYHVTNRPRWHAHVTVVRSGKEAPVDLTHWGKYEGEKVDFVYDSTIHQGKVYYWLNIYCKRLEKIRKELGLPVVSMYTLPPEGFNKVFHMTIANCKFL